MIRLRLQELNLSLCRGGHQHVLFICHNGKNSPTFYICNQCLTVLPHHAYHLTHVLQHVSQYFHCET